MKNTFTFLHNNNISVGVLLFFPFYANVVEAVSKLLTILFLFNIANYNKTSSIM